MVIETANLVKEYADRRVVNNVSIRVEQGSIVGLLGPNGAGKTTTFYMIVGIIKPDSGTVTLDGQDISGLPMYMRARAGIGYLPQEASIFRKMTVEENILAILEANNVPEKERYEKMNALVEEFHIDHIRKNKGTELSGGEAQRIKLATELSRRSTGKTVYILDEPTTGLHFADVHKLTEILRRLAADGNTVIVIEHNLDVIKTADYIIDIGPEGGDKGGTVVACGTPEEVAENPNSYTGKYIKMMLDRK